MFSIVCLFSSVDYWRNGRDTLYIRLTSRLAFVIHQNIENTSLKESHSLSSLIRPDETSSLVADNMDVL